jgi:hypothetical protein
MKGEVQETTERRNTEHRTSNIERRTSNPEKRQRDFADSDCKLKNENCKLQIGTDNELYFRHGSGD